MSKYTIGIDLGGTTMTAGLVDENYDIVGKITWATRLPRPAADLEKALADLCRAVARDNKVAFSDIAYVGIGTPGSVNFNTGFVGFNTNFVYGDGDANGTVEATDALWALQAYVGSRQLDEKAFKAADVNLDKEVNTSDALAILQYAVKLRDKLPIA